MAKFKVTGGESGLVGVTVNDLRYEPGETVELSQAKAQWLVDKGVLVAVGGGKKSAKTSEPEAVTDDIDWIEEGI